MGRLFNWRGVLRGATEKENEVSFTAALGSQRGYIFDLDGTLVDSKLDFQRLRQRLGWPDDCLILEHLATLPSEEQHAASAIIHQFELEGALQATVIDGAKDLLAQLKALQLPTAILTRNSRAVTTLTLQRLQLDVDLVLSRDDAPAKPNPAGLWHIAQHWQIAPAELLFIGDYLFDLQTADAAGMPSCLYLDGSNAHFAPLATHQIRHFAELSAACWQQHRR